MLFDWLILGQIIPMNPAAPVRGPKHVVKKSKTLVLKSEEARLLIAEMNMVPRDLQRQVCLQ